MGGGSAQLVAHYRVTILDALRDRLGDEVEIVHEAGADTVRSLPVLGGGGDDGAQIVAPDGTDGLALDIFQGPDFVGEPVERQSRPTGELFCFGPPSPAAGREFSARLLGTLTAEESGPWELSLAQSGAARLLVDGAVVIDGATRPLPPGPSFFGTGSEEVRVELDLVAGRSVEIVVELANPTGSLLSGVRVGARPAPPTDLVDRAVAAAAAADTVVLVVGTSREWESEGHDRDTMDLPGGQDELVARVLDVAPDAVVVVNAGAPVTMPWADRAKADRAGVVRRPGDGQRRRRRAHGAGRSRRSAADDDPRAARAQPVASGTSRPRMARSATARDCSSATAGTRPGTSRPGSRSATACRTRCSRSARPGCRRRPSLPALNKERRDAGGRGRRDQHRRTLGERGGAVLRRPPRRRLARPPKELKAFAKVALEPGATATVALELDARSFAYWKPDDRVSAELASRMQTWLTSSRPAAASDDTSGWTVDAGTYELHLGRSSADIAHVVEVEVPEDVFLGRLA